MNTGFELHPRLDADTIALAELPLCSVRLMNDARFPWLILVPRRAGVCEIAELDPWDRQALMEEVARASVALRQVVATDRINVAALGNVVPQLHVHVVARLHGDAAWPGPVWGSGAAQPYAAQAAT
ncbi:MAG TPA: HIT family protein, partial [Xanthomonadaceae bacterium]|nr:HIT family protein [Xanthomonadaceae bacterium]